MSSSNEPPSSTSIPDPTVFTPPPLDTVTEIHIPPRIDERCFTYCTQRSNSRTFKSEPTCHTFCWRKIYDYEKVLIDHAAGRPGRLTIQLDLPFGVGAEQAQKMKKQNDAEMQRLRALATRAGIFQEPPRPATEKPTLASLRKQHEEQLAKLEKIRFNEGDNLDEDVRKLKELSNQIHDTAVKLGEAAGKDNNATQRAAPKTTFPGWLYPFPSPQTDNWSFLRGHYVYYARGPRRASYHMVAMHHVGLAEGWLGAVAVAKQREGQDVGAMLDSTMMPPEKEAAKAMGLKDLRAEDRKKQAKKPKWDPDYAMLISLEHLPPAIYNNITNSIQRVYAPVVSLLDRYRQSFASGQQSRNARMIWARVQDPEDGPLGTLKRLGEAFERRRKQIEEETKEKEREKRHEGKEGESKP